MTSQKLVFVFFSITFWELFFLSIQFPVFGCRRRMMMSALLRVLFFTITRAARQWFLLSWQSVYHRTAWNCEKRDTKRREKKKKKKKKKRKKNSEAGSIPIARDSSRSIKVYSLSVLRVGAYRWGVYVWLIDIHFVPNIWASSDNFWKWVGE